MIKPCTQCVALRAQIAILKLRIEQLLLQIKKLVRRIKAVRAAMYTIMAESCTVTKKRSGVPRAEFAYHKGRCEVAKQVLNLLRGV